MGSDSNAGSVARIALGVETDGLRRKQQAQEKARLLATELVANVLDIQITQLEENGLTKLPIFADIKSMRGNVDGMVDRDMQAIIEALVKLQDGKPAERTKKFNEVRGQVREVVVKLMAERQKLFRRMQIQKIALQVQQLINMQTKTHKVTIKIPEKPRTEQETLALNTIEDQSDVRQLYFVLVDTLTDVSTWGGTAGAGASDGLRILKVAQVADELTKAGESLGKADYAVAGESQIKVIKGLKLLLEKLEETQGLINSDREAAMKLVNELMKKQEKLREETKKADLDPAKPESA